MKKKALLQAALWAAAAALCILCAYCVEKYVFNADVSARQGLSQSYDLAALEQTGFVYEDGALVTEQTYAQLVIPTGGYVYKLHMDYQAGDNIAAAWSAERVQDLTKVDVTNMLGFDYRTQSADRLIDTEGEQLVLTFIELASPLRISEISVKNSDMFHWQRFLAMAAILMSLATLALTFRSIKKHPEWAVAIVCGLLGVAMLGAVPYEKNCWDDETHFATAYRMSYALLGKDTQWDQAAEQFVKQWLPIPESYEERLRLEEYLDQLGETPGTVEEREGISYYLNKADALPTAIGILIGRNTGADFSDWFLWARLANLLFYGVVICFAVRIIPVGKSLLAFLALLPTPLFLTVSYNTDFFMNGLMMLGAAVFFREYFEADKKLRTRSILLFTAVMFFACIRKSIYIPLILVGLLLPDSKFKSKRQKYIYRGILAGCCLLVMLVVLLSASGMTDVRGENTSVAGQVSYILANPFSFAVMFVKEIAASSLEFIMDGEGKLNFNVNGEVRGGTIELLMVITLTMLVLCGKGSEDRYVVKGKTAVWGLGLIGLVICFIWGSMYLSYTPVGQNSVEGVQARYYTPFLFLLFMLLPFNKKIKCYLSERTLMQIALLAAIVINGACIFKILILP